MRRFLIAAVPFMSLLAIAGTASADASGSYFITNSSLAPVSLAANTLSGNVSFPSIINAGSTVYASAEQTNGSNVYVGTFIYENAAGIGCTFTTTVIRSSSTSRYSFTFRAAPYGTSSTAICSLTPTSSSATTGVYNANAVMSGF